MSTVAYTGNAAYRRRVGVAKTVLMPRGPVVMWNAVGAPQSNLTLRKAAEAMGDRSQTPEGIAVPTTQRADWAAGRDFSDEEAKVGMLTTLNAAAVRASSRAAQRSPASATSSPPLVVAPIPRLGAVIKADVGDWQANELEAGTGDPAFLTRRPKARWVKISKDQTEKIEADPSEDFHMPYKSFNERVVNYGFYKPVVGELPPNRPVLQFSLYRENMGLDAVLRRVQHRARVQPSRLDFASPKDGFGAISQLGSGIGVPKEKLIHANRHYNINALFFNPLQHAGPEAVVDQCDGNAWRILLRCVEGSASSEEEEEEGAKSIGAALQRIRDGGFVNYFPLSTFGATSNFAHEIAGAAARGDYLDACRFWFQSEAERNPVVFKSYVAYVNSHNHGQSAAGVLTELLKDLKEYRMERRLGKFVTALRELSTGASDGDDREALQRLWFAVPAADRAAMVSAAPAFVWNAMASQRLLAHGPGAVVPGDLVVTEGGKQVHTVLPGETASFSIEDVVLPIPTSSSLAPEAQPLAFPEAPSGIGRDLYERFASEHKLDDAIGAWRSRALDHAPVYRPLVVRPGSMTWRVIDDDPDSLTMLKTDRFLREERRPVGRAFESARVRTPTPLQVPPALRERMQPVVHDKRSGTASVAVAFELPPGSHPTVMLRESFALRHVNFHDLLSPVPVDGMRAANSVERRAAATK